MKRIVIISDVQYPLHNKRAVKNLWNFIGETKPDGVGIIGDFMNYAGPSRWTKGTKAEFEGRVMEESAGGHKLLVELRDGYDGPMWFMKGNHDIRPEEYLMRYAPALADSGAFSIETLLGLEGLNIEVLPPFSEIAPGWVAMHGHEIKGLNQLPGRTAASKVKKLDRSVVMGHTHKLAVSPETVGVGRRQRTLFGFEVGHLMDPLKAEYLTQGVSNWQLGFGVLEVGRYGATPVPIYMDRDGSFVYSGERWGAIKRAGNGKFAPVATAA
ncbi:metallophosphoesterase family protein [Spirillospora sp. NPDC127200]